MSTRRLVHALVAAALTAGASLAVYRVYTNIKRGGEAEASRAQQILGVRHAWLVGPSPNNLV